MVLFILYLFMVFIELVGFDFCCGDVSSGCTRFFFISTPFFSAQPGVAYRETVFEPQVCSDVCLTSQRIFVYEITKRLC